MATSLGAVTAGRLLAACSPSGPTVAPATVTPQPEIAMCDAEIISSPVEQLAHHYRINSPADGQEDTVVGVEKILFRDKCLEFLKHRAKVK